MTFLSLAGILFVFYACRTNGVGLLYDFTDQLNAIRAGNLSIEELSATMVYGFGRNLKGTEIFSLTGVYSPDCEITVECGPGMNEAIQIFHDVNRALFQRKVEIKYFHFHFRIEISALANLKIQTNQTKLYIPAGYHGARFILPEKTTCDDLINVTTEHWRILLNPSTWFLHHSGHSIGVGVGYNEDLIGCEWLYDALQTSEVVLTFLSPGKTAGVVESFGLFKKRMDNLHARNIDFLKNNPHFNYKHYKLPFIVYSQTSQSLGDEYHRYLLEGYWGRFSSNRVSATAPMPFRPFKIPDYSDKRIIPYIDAKSCYGGNSIPWKAPAALKVLSRHFGTVVLTHVEWKELNSNSIGSAANGKAEIQLDLFIDYTDWLQNTPNNPAFKGRDYNWSPIEKEFDKTEIHPLQNIKVTTLVFPVTVIPTTQNLTVNVNSDFAERMSSGLVIGCGFFWPSNHYTASAVVAACKQVNGSLYMVQSHFKLKSITKVSRDNSQHFENVVRPQLEDQNKFRKEILVLHPQATVYFQIRVELQIEDNHATAFCNSEALSLNEYIEATVNWATFNGIPLIMGRAFDCISSQKYQTWFSVLRPMFQDLSDLNPYFILHNSPQILKDADVEPCIEWTVGTPTINETFFHKEYLGSTFVASEIRNGTPITRDEYKILLQFMLHRFDILSVHLERYSYEDFIPAMNTLASEGLIDPRKKFFLSCGIIKNYLQVSYEFLNFTKATLGSNISFLKGISVNLEVLDFNEEVATNTTKVLGWGKSLNLHMGLTYETSICQNLGLAANSRKHKSEEFDNLLKTAEYLLCYEFGKNWLDYDNPKRLGKIFDRHLYVKKFFQDYYPHLHVYFEVVLVSTPLTWGTMPRYLRLLSNFQAFAVTYNLTYIIVTSFEPEGIYSTGWWKISNYSNLSLTSVYEEKYSAYVGSKTWWPPLHLEPNQTTHTTTDNKQNIILVVSFSGLVLMIFGFGLLAWYYKNKKPQYLSNEDENIFYNGKEGTGEERVSGDSEYLKFDKKFELAFADVFIDPKDLLGRGNFGTVYKGLVKEEPVAIKRPNENCSATSFKSVLCEIKVLCYIGTHSNVVRFVGAYTKEIRKGILYIAAELCSNGSLDGLLRAKKRVISTMVDSDNEVIGTEDKDAVHFYDLHRFAKEIASGMEYIEGKNVIHGDLSARNVLLDENFTCKIGDFGLSRKLYEYLEYVKQSQEPLPWKWMAYESLKNMHFTSKSDVWSYGVTLWEIYSLGSVPYGGLSWTTGFADDLKNGLRLQMPEYATEEIYKTMLSCWDVEADERPNFTDMVDFFKQFGSSQYTVLELQ